MRAVGRVRIFPAGSFDQLVEGVVGIVAHRLHTAVVSPLQGLRGIRQLQHIADPVVGIGQVLQRFTRFAGAPGLATLQAIIQRVVGQNTDHAVARPLDFDLAIGGVGSLLYHPLLGAAAGAHQQRGQQAIHPLLEHLPIAPGIGLFDQLARGIMAPLCAPAAGFQIRLTPCAVHRPIGEQGYVADKAPRLARHLPQQVIALKPQRACRVIMADQPPAAVEQAVFCAVVGIAQAFDTTTGRGVGALFEHGAQAQQAVVFTGVPCAPGIPAVAQLCPCASQGDTYTPVDMGAVQQAPRQ